MIAEYYKQSQECDSYYSDTDYIMYKKYTYASCLEYLDNNGITVKMPPQAVTPLNTGDAVMSAIHENSFESDLISCGKWWGKGEVEVFLNGGVFTGIPIHIDKNTLRVENGSHSYAIPIEKIECIRIADGSFSPNTKQSEKNDTDSLNI